jgi:hypothetical protein
MDVKKREDAVRCTPGSWQMKMRLMHSLCPGDQKHGSGLIFRRTKKVGEEQSLSSLISIHFPTFLPHPLTSQGSAC